MIPFNYPLYQSGLYDPITREKDPVLQLTLFETTDPQPLFGVVNGSVECWNITGQWSSHTAGRDLFLIKKIV